MMPSMPRLSTPARSQISSPMVAKISGEAMRIAATQKEAVKRISRASITVHLTLNRVKQDRHDHGEQRGRDHDVGDVARHARPTRLMASAPTKMPATKIADATTPSGLSMASMATTMPE